MRLQSKKSAGPLSAPVIGVFLLSLAYWVYLSLTTRMDITQDAIGYEQLGRMIHTQGWLAYFTTGPNREPLYPWLVATSMQIGDALSLSYTRIMAFFGIAILLLTQIMVYKGLRLFNVRQSICIMLLAYFALSPALNNAAFSLYSEIVAFPIILGIILVTNSLWQAITANRLQRALVYSVLLGVLFVLAVLAKAAFEAIAPVYLIILFIAIVQNGRPKAPAVFICFLVVAGFYYIPVTGYKLLNQGYNGSFAVTNRASFALYGNTIRRMQPLTLKRSAEALAFAAGEGVCNSLFGEQECDFWSFRKSDRLGYGKLQELQARHLSPSQINTLLVGLSVEKALQNPFQYVFLDLVEGLKMFFWESTKIGFVDYPPWLQKIYDIKGFDNALRLVMSVASLIAVIALWLNGRGKSPIASCTGLLVFLYIFFFSFFFILTRYALPIAPLYLIAIGAWLNQNLAPKKSN